MKKIALFMIFASSCCFAYYPYQKQGTARQNPWTGDVEYRDNLGSLQGTAHRNQWTNDVEFRDNLGTTQGRAHTNPWTKEVEFYGNGF